MVELSMGVEALYNALEEFDNDRRLGIISVSDHNFIKKRIDAILEKIEFIDD